MTTFPPSPFMSSVRSCLSSWLHDRNRTQTSLALGKWRRLSSCHLPGGEKGRYSSYLKEGVIVACMWEVPVLEMRCTCITVRNVWETTDWFGDRPQPRPLGSSRFLAVIQGDKRDVLHACEMDKCVQDSCCESSKRPSGKPRTRWRNKIIIFYGDSNCVMDFSSFPEIVSWNRRSHMTATRSQIR